jgi:hypothetical protein
LGAFLTHAFNNIYWKRNETAPKRISKARQASTAKMCHNLSFMGARHELWYGEAKPFCMCGQHEDWRHILTCKSLDAEMIRTDLWSKLKKQMDKWSLSSDMWISMESGVWNYTMNPLKSDPENMPPEPSSPFGTMLYTPRNILKVAFRAQSQIGWENFQRGRLSRGWITCMDYHFQMNGSKLTGQECNTKLILGLWENMYQIWTYHNNRYHENTSQQVARYKTEALGRRYEEIWVKHAGLVERLHDFQTKHFENRQNIGNLNHESKRCLARLYDEYITELASPIRSEMYTLSEFLGARLGVG